MNKISRSIFINFIEKLLGSKNITEDILDFIVQHKQYIEEIKLDTLISLKGKYVTSLESVLFLVLLAEISKVTKNDNIRVFILYIIQTDKEHSLEGIKEFIKNDISFFLDKPFLDRFLSQSLPLFYQYIQGLFNVIFESRYELAKFSEDIALKSINSNELRSDLSYDQKNKLKDDMFNMTKDLYASIFPIYKYLVEAHVNNVDAIHYQTIEDNNRLIEAIKFYVLYDKKQAILFLEKLKGKVFIENLSLKSKDNNIEHEQLMKLKQLQDQVFYLQQQSYLTDNLFKHLNILYESKLQLHQMQIQFKYCKDSLTFDRFKSLL